MYQHSLFFFQASVIPPLPPPPTKSGMFSMKIYVLNVFRGRLCILVICCQLATYIGNFTPHHSASLSFEVYKSGRSKFLVQIQSVGVPKIKTHFQLEK